MSKSLRRMWIQLTADRRRFGVLCATLGVGLLLWARLIIVSNVPRTAVADPGRSSAIDAAPKSPSAAADKPVGSRGGAAGKDARRSSEPIAVTLHGDFRRDPFVISPEHFPKASASPEVKQEAGKLPTEPAEDPFQTQARREARLRELLGSVKLEAAMGSSMAVIDGKRYRVGDRLPAQGKERVEFTLVEVKQRSIVLEHQGVRFEVVMSLPGGGPPDSAGH